MTSRLLAASTLALVSRRSLMLGVTMLPLAAGACATADVEKAERLLKIVVKNAKVIAGGLKGVLAQLGALNVPGLTPAILAVVGTAVDGTIKVAGDLEAVTSLAAAQPLVEKIGTYVQTVVGALATLPLPERVTTGLRAAAILLPVIETAVGLVANSAADPGMSPDQARAVLLAAAG